jgi:hypothetical protein
MAAFVGFNKFLDQVTEGVYNIGTDTLKIALTDTAPTAATDTVFDILVYPAPAEAHGYTSNGETVTVASHGETGGTWTLGCTADIVVTASGGAIGPFRYAVLYDTAGVKGVIGYWDYGSSVTLADGETFTIAPNTSLLTLAFV